jgi:hypothetical protein
MIQLTGINEGEQSRLLQHKNTIESLTETLATIEQEDSPDEKQIHEYKSKIENEKETLRVFVQGLIEDSEQSNIDEWIDYVLNAIAEVEKYITFLPDDIEKTVRALLNEFKKALKLIKEIF